MPLITRGPLPRGTPCPGRREGEGGTLPCTCACSSPRVRRRGWLRPSQRRGSGSGEAFGNAAEHSRLLCPAPRSLPPGGLGTAGLPTGGSFDRLPPPPTLPRRGGRDVCWTPGGDAALETRRANKYPHPAPPDPLLLASPAWRLRLMLRKWRGCFSSVKDFSRDKRRSPAGRKSHGSKREFYPAHGDGMGPGIVVLAKVKWVPKVKPGAPAEGGSRNTSQAAQPSPSTRAGASRDARHPRELKPEEERSPVPALRRISPRTQNSLETR